MQDNTQEALNDLIDLIDESDIPVDVTSFDVKEYLTGDPTATDTEATGAEIDIGCFLSLETDDDDGDVSQFRVK